MSKKQYIKASNEAPKLPIGSIAFWFMFIKYFNLPEWTLGVWGLLGIIMLVSFIVRMSTEDGVDVVER